MKNDWHLLHALKLPLHLVVVFISAHLEVSKSASAKKVLMNKDEVHQLYTPLPKAQAPSFSALPTAIDHSSHRWWKIYYYIWNMLHLIIIKLHTRQKVVQAIISE